MLLDIARRYIDYAEKDVLRIPQSSTTSTDGSATLSTFFGKVACSSRTLAYGTEETLAITNTNVATGDIVLASVIASTGGTAGLVNAITQTNTITVTISNFHGTDENTTAYTIAFLLIKAA